jgi:hypothetical protein
MHLFEAIIDVDHRGLAGVKFEKLLEQVPALRKAMGKGSGTDQ